MYKAWKGNAADKYEDVPGLCKSVKLEIIIDNNYVISPNRYIEPPKQEITTDVSIDHSEIQNQISRLSDGISEFSESIINRITAEEDIQVGILHEVKQIAQELSGYSSSLYQALIKEYLIDYNLNSSEKKLPSTWKAKSFGEIFKERKLKVSTGFVTRFFFEGL